MPLLRTMARTTVVAGTATAVSGRVARRQQQRWAGPEQQQMAAQAPAAAAAGPGGGCAGPGGGCAGAGRGLDREAQGARSAAPVRRSHRRGVRGRQGKDPQLIFAARLALSMRRPAGVNPSREPGQTRTPASIRPATRLGALGLAENHEPVDADQADRKDAERPPWVRAAHVQQRAERAEGRREDPDEAPVAAATEEREARRSAGSHR